MPKVDFYLLEETDERAWLRLACRLTEKAFAQSHQVCISVDSPAAAETLDKLLWTFRDRSFIPHAIFSGGGPADEPVLIAPEILPQQSDVLINLRPQVPADFERFTRVIEPLDGDPDRRRQGRARFKHYREQGLAPDSHDLSGHDS